MCKARVAEVWPTELGNKSPTRPQLQNVGKDDGKKEAMCSSKQKKALSWTAWSGVLLCAQICMASLVTSFQQQILLVRGVITKDIVLTS